MPLICDCLQSLEWGTTQSPEGNAGGPEFCPQFSLKSMAAVPSSHALEPVASRNRGLYLRKTLAALGPVGY